MNRSIESATAMLDLLVEVPLGSKSSMSSSVLFAGTLELWEETTVVHILLLCVMHVFLYIQAFKSIQALWNLPLKSSCQGDLTIVCSQLDGDKSEKPSQQRYLIPPPIWTWKACNSKVQFACITYITVK